MGIDANRRSPADRKFSNSPSNWQSKSSGGKGLDLEEFAKSPTLGERLAKGGPTAYNLDDSPPNSQPDPEGFIGATVPTIRPSDPPPNTKPDPEGFIGPTIPTAPPAAASPPESEQIVDESADKIEKLVGSGASKEDIIEAADEFTGHDADTTNAIFDELEDRGVLDEFAEEFYDRSFIPSRNDVSVEQRGEYYQEFAGKLSGENLAVLTAEFKDKGGEIAVWELSTAVTSEASDEVKLEYINHIKDQAVNDDSSSYHLANGVQVDFEGAAIARVIASVDDPENIEQALASLSDEQFASVVNAVTVRQPWFVDVDKHEDYVEFAEAVGRIDSSVGKRGVEQVARFLHLNGDLLRKDPAVDAGTGNNPAIKDALGQVFSEHLENFVGHSSNGSGAIKTEPGNDIEIISQYVLFSDPPGTNQEAQAEKVASVISELIETAQIGEPGDETKIGGKSSSRKNVANVAGQLLFHTTKGLSNAIEKGEQDNESRDAAAKFLVGIAFDLIPAPGADKIGDKFAEKVVGSVFDEAKGATKSEILENIKAQDIGVNPQGFNDFYKFLRESIGRSESTSIDPNSAVIRDAFENGYDGPE